MIIIIISLLTIFVILKNNVFNKQKSEEVIDKTKVEEYITTFKSANYHAKLSYYMKEKEGSPVYFEKDYDYKDNIAKINLYDKKTEYINYKTKEHYLLDDGKLAKMDYKEKSDHENILELLSSYEIVEENKDNYVLKLPEKNIEKFFDNYKDIFKYNKKYNYELIMIVDGTNITEIHLKATENKYIDYKFTNINQIGNIEIPKSS